MIFMTTILKVRQHFSGVASRNSRNIKYGLCNIYFKLTSFNIQIIILFNDMKYHVAAKQKNLCSTHKHKKDIFDNYSLREHVLLNFQSNLFNTCTQGLNAGKSFSDYLFMS